MSKNIWDYEGLGWLVIPTNCQTNSQGHAIMGAGLALQAKKKYPDFAKELGFFLSGGDYVPIWYSPKSKYEEFGLLAFPTKYKWKEDSSLELIDEMAKYLANSIEGNEKPYYFPRIGCGLGNLKWEQVKPILEKHLGEFIKTGQVIFLEP